MPRVVGLDKGSVKYDYGWERIVIHKAFLVYVHLQSNETNFGSNVS